MNRLVGIASLLLLSCASGAFEFAPVASMQSADKARYKDAAAVVLLRQVGLFEANDPGRTHYTEYRRHDLVHILSEAGFANAQIRINIGNDGELLYLHARTIAPDGSEQVVMPSEVLEDDTSDSKTKTKNKQKVFRFPGVTVGSRLEYAFAVGVPSSYTFDSERVSDTLPIEQYELEIALHHNIVGAVALFNRPETFVQSRDGNVAHFKITLRNVPAQDKGWFSLPWQDHEAWWAFRVARFQLGANYRLLNDTWERTLSDTASSLYIDDGKWMKGLPRLLDAKDCGKDKRCVLTKALETLRNTVGLKGFVGGLSAARSLKAALDDKLANNFEEAMLAYRMLKDNGVEVRYVLAGRDDGLFFERQFPLPNQFDHLLLYVGAQDGLSAPLFVDPSCEHCALGQLPSWIAGKEGVVITGKHSANDGIAVTVEFKTITGTPPPPSGQRREHSIKIVGSDVEGKVEIVSEGSEAVDAELSGRNRSDKDWQETNEKWLHARVKSGELVESKARVCDRQKALCQMTLRYRLPQYVVADGDAALLPLALVYSGYDSPDRKLAKGALHAWTNEHYEDVLNVELQKGFEVAALPAAVSIKTPIVDVSCEATKSATGLRYRRSIAIKEGDLQAGRHSEVEDAIKAFAKCRTELVSLRPSATKAPAKSPR